jgi:hypothetical protein
MQASAAEAISNAATAANTPGSSGWRQVHDSHLDDAFVVFLAHAGSPVAILALFVGTWIMTILLANRLVQSCSHGWEVGLRSLEPGKYQLHNGAVRRVS